MNPSEIITYLNAKVQHFAMAPGGIPTITSEDVSHILALVERRAQKFHIEPFILSQYVRLIHLGQSSYSESVARALRREIRNIKQIEKWRVPRKEFLLDMCFLALSEAHDARICPDCLGRAGGTINGRYIVCEPCKGTGKRKITDKDRAEALGIHPDSFYNTWRKRYRLIQTQIDKWEDIFQTSFRRVYDKD